MSLLRRPGCRFLLGALVVLVVCSLFFYESRFQTDTIMGRGGAFSRPPLRLGEDLPAAAAAAAVAATEAAGVGGGGGREVAELPPSTTPVWNNPVYAERRHRSENMCSVVRGGKVERLTRYGNVSYCVVPKVGCTFWLNVFRFLHKDTGPATYTSPFSIPRMVTHYGPMKSMKYFRPNNTFTPPHLKEDLRFMFVREPYSRLWSAYVDKFLLIDYWRSEGKNIVKLRENKTTTTMCARDISFKEFVEFVATRPGDGQVLNEHWKPIKHLCSPCLYQPHVIGKIETFSRDSRYVLARMNSSWILDAYDHQQHVYQEMDMLVDYNFPLLGGKPYINCTDATDLSRRLWKTFQINGYIPTEQPFPAVAGMMNASRFKTLAHDAYRNRPTKSPSEWRLQREQSMADAFRDISTETMERLAQLYHEDFLMFDYNPFPDSLFSHRREEMKKREEERQREAERRDAERRVKEKIERVRKEKEKLAKEQKEKNDKEEKRKKREENQHKQNETIVKTKPGKSL